MESHNGSGEEVGIINPVADRSGNCVCGLVNTKLNLAVGLRFNKKQLPWLTNWQHWGQGEYVTAIEPGTNPPIGQAQAREQSLLIQLAPGEARTYDLKIEVMENEAEIKTFLSARYGDFILFKPPVQSNTLILWFAPFAALLGGAAVAFLVLKKRRSSSKNTQIASQVLLSDDERKELEARLK